MKDFFFRLGIYLMVILFCSGCALKKNISPSLPVDRIDDTAGKPPAFFKDKNKYYYFLEAQLQGKSGNIDEAISFLMKAIEKDPDSQYLQRELGILYLRQKNYAKGLSILKRVIEENPEDVETLIMYGRINHDLGQIDEAQKAYKKIIAIDPIDPERQNIHLLSGSIYMEEGDLISAFQVYEHLVHNFPESYAGHFFLGKIYAKQGNINDAEIEFKKTIELEPGLEEPRNELLNLYKKQGKSKKIIQTYKEILENNPGNIDAALGLGYAYYKGGMKSKAKELLKDLGKRSASEIEIIRNVVKLYIDQKKYEAASIILDEMLIGAPNSPDLNYIAGIAFDGANDKTTAITHFKKVTQGSMFYNNAVGYISFLYQEQKKFDEAINYLKNVTKNSPGNPEFRIYLASIYESTGNFEEAEKNLKQGIEFNPENPGIHFRLGVIYDKWGKKEDSIKEMKTVIRLESDNADALNYLGYTYAEMGQNLDEAEQLIREALKYKPDDGYIIDSLAWVYFKKGYFKEAIKLLERAVTLVPDDPVVSEHLGDAYMKIDNKKQALKYYNRSLLNKNKDRADLEKKIRELTK